MAANMNRPKPVTPASYAMHATIDVHCICGHTAKMIVGDVVRRHSLPGAILLHQIITRLRCSDCGLRNPFNAEVR